jgi:hypothetical protein
MRKGMMIFRTHRCKGCENAASCGVKGRFKEIHRPLEGDAVDELVKRMKSEEGQAIYAALQGHPEGDPSGSPERAARKQIVEPVLGVLKHDRGFLRFLLRGKTGAGAEWSLMCIAHNLGKWAQSALAGAADAALRNSKAWGQIAAHICRCAFALLRSGRRTVLRERLRFLAATDGKSAPAA